MKYGNHQPNQTGGKREAIASSKARVFPFPNSSSPIEFKTYDKTHYSFKEGPGGLRRLTAKPMSKKNRCRLRRGLEPLIRKNGLL